MAVDSLPGLYLHVPFCTAICPYCDFSVLVGGEERRRAFVDCLIAELDLSREGDLPGVSGFDTIYFGGGTPSLLELESLARILREVEEGPGARDPWIFLEANPEDVTVGRLASWRDLGVRTLSLGVQSFDAEELRFLGRVHTPEQARRSVELALEAGFRSVSVDLIYGLPGQSAASWSRQLETAVELGPQHLSCYQLTVHRKTVFGVRLRRGQLEEMPASRQAKLFLLTHRRLAELGFEGYEVSNFARAPAHRSQHNRKYWDHTPYLGLGPSAHSYADGRRWWNHWALGRWQTSVEAGERPVAESERLDRRQLALERLMLGLRTLEGVDLQELDRLYGVDPRVSDTRALESLVETGKLILDGARLRPTLAGLAVAEGIARDLTL